MLVIKVIIILQKGAKMINGNNFEALTHNGISQLFSETFQQQEFILQVIQVLPFRGDVFSIFLSDGFTWIKGELVNEAKKQAIKSNLSTYSVIKFRVQNIEAITGNEYSFKLKVFQIVNSSKQNPIGQPVPFKDFKKKQDYINFESGNVISGKQYYTITEVKQMSPAQLSLRIFGKVIRKPDKIKYVMNITIQDEEREQIQCCFFDDNAEKYKDFIEINKWYYFEDPVLQINNKFGIMELKINNHSKVVKQTRESEVKPGIINYNNNSSKKKQEEKNTKENNASLTQFIMKDNIAKGNPEEHDKFIIARPLSLFNMKNKMARVFNCVDRFGVEVEILLWDDCKAQIQLNQTYRFNHLKTKKFNEKFSLQSQKGMTKVVLSDFKILSRSELSKGKTEDVVSRQSRTLGFNDIVYSITEMKEKCQKSIQKSIFIISCGYLVVKFDFMGGNGNDNFNQLRRKLFYVHCEKCENNQYLRSKIEPESMNGKVVCNGCKSETIRVLWNIKTVFMDSQTEVVCKINSEIAEKLIDMTPSEGMLLYLDNQEALKTLIQKKLNFKRGVFKFSSKLNDRVEGERYYNICQFYEDGGKIFALRAANELKRVLNAFQKFTAKPQTIHEEKNTDQNSQTKKRSKNNQIQRQSYFDEEK